MRIFIHEKYLSDKNEETSESEASYPEDNGKSKRSERLVIKLLIPNILEMIMRKH